MRIQLRDQTCTQVMDTTAISHTHPSLRDQIWILSTHPEISTTVMTTIGRQLSRQCRICTPCIQTAIATTPPQHLMAGMQQDPLPSPASNVWNTRPAHQPHLSMKPPVHPSHVALPQPPNIQIPVFDSENTTPSTAISASGKQPPKSSQPSSPLSCSPSCFSRSSTTNPPRAKSAADEPRGPNYSPPSYCFLPLDSLYIYHP